MASALPKDLQSLLDRPPVYRLLNVADRVEGRHLNHVWKGLVGTGYDEPGLPVFVKLLPSQAQIDIELACGLASQVLKLPVPMPGVVLADPEDLPGLPPRDYGPEVILFGSVFQAPDQFLERRKRELQAHGDDYLWNRVCNSDTAPKGAAWDELVANPDRHIDNFLFDGIQWWLFDHNQALQPVASLYAEVVGSNAQDQVVSHVARANQLLEQLRDRHLETSSVESEAETFLKQARKLKVLANGMRSWQVESGRISQIFQMAALIVDLIALRLEPLSLYIAQRLERPDAESLWS